LSAEAWIGVAGVVVVVLAQLGTGVFFFGRIDQSVRGIREESEKTGNRVEWILKRIGSHHGRIAWLEARAGMKPPIDQDRADDL
jgi:hypothetical protein